MTKEQILKIFRNKNNLTIILIFIIGVVLMITANGGKKKTLRTGETQAVNAYADATGTEERLAKILSEIDGAGEVSVMITYYSGIEKNLAYETKSTSRDGGGDVSEDTKAVIAGGEPIVLKEMYPSVKGVIVAAEGAGSAAVKTAISEAVMASLDVPAHRICIFKKEED